MKRVLTSASLRAIGLVLAASATLATPAIAAKTQAGTTIANTAKATFDLPGGGSAEVTSNTVNILVDELLDMSVAPLDSSGVSVTPASTNRVLTFKVTNAGNGNENFRLTARDSVTGDNFDPTTTSIVLDSNNNGTYEPGVDTVYTAGSNDPLLAPDASITVFVLSSIPAGVTDGQKGNVELTATAVTGSGTAGTTFADKGDNGGDAVVGATTAQALSTGFYVASAATVTFVKSASVVDPFGGSTQVPGSIITYSLVATVNGSGTMENLVITDAVPTGTTYQGSSITLGGSALSDPTDSDAGEMSGGTVSVRLGDVAGGSNRSVTFKVKVN